MGTFYEVLPGNLVFFHFCYIGTKENELLDHTTELYRKNYTSMENYTSGVQNLTKTFRDQTVIDDSFNSSALIVIPWSIPENSHYCKCYKDESPQEFMEFFAPIYNKFNRPQPNVYLEKANIDQAKKLG